MLPTQGPPLTGGWRQSRSQVVAHPSVSGYSCGGSTWARQSRRSGVSEKMAVIAWYTCTGVHRSQATNKASCWHHRKVPRPSQRHAILLHATPLCRRSSWSPIKWALGRLKAVGSTSYYCTSCGAPLSLLLLYLLQSAIAITIIVSVPLAE